MDSRRILVIAGSDSSGGAGLEADQKVIAAHGCYAMTATTALTAQNTTGVVGIHPTPPDFVRKQIDACLDDVGVDVVKTGMLTSADIVNVVADALKRHGVKTCIVDPVMVSTSGSQLLPPDAVRNLRENLIPLTTILTPNIPEAKLLLSDAGKTPTEPGTLEDVISLARSLHTLGSKYILLKGGHLPLTKDHHISTDDAEKEAVIDILFDGTNVTLIETPYLKARNTHGTGCSLASAIASNLVLGYDVQSAVRNACRYVEAGIKTSQDLGKGSGPINHFHSTYILPYTPDHFIDYLLEHPSVKAKWHEFTHHEFLTRLADGTLPENSFKHFLVQDYLYLVQFARVHAMAAYKSETIDEIAAAAEIVLHIKREMTLHLTYCTTFNLTQSEIEAHSPDTATKLYASHLLQTAHARPLFHLRLALLPCLLGYYAIAARMHADPATVKGRYWKWIENYVAEDYVQAVDVGRADVEARAKGGLGLREVEEARMAFLGGLECEIRFWEQGLRGGMIVDMDGGVDG
ncbi:MAG: hypothetical protein M1834_006665 [Cirrosporium novae-zelandiae]|nr:MAG: hypothetical protein M1834_006665 [Cirrosporium novae-zelandiae]